uniref:ATP synthase complex subunit 8 n=2 Tax=Caligula TaxID=180279 RepID=Q45GB1_9NEOP|nr:ATP synthase F0 subunit 8 [Saturnia boisduvalii]YP_010383236.1 ATP synthase F0 subunit 8 [Saturnia japonica]AAZ66741.1 ATP synthase subunit 8 [Saturnia japonica]ABQ63465.1 ATP synthase F0 subunit 8 [Saturnia boisduvalii]QUG09884.1 ATP synthase F0 subunit 8 [Saturnia japonica]QYK91412.1 ATP synthase F0 subunit 8 [Saturnia japonica]UEQ12615.1 ATP synthase F0 subunit 8 [Saturnia japonica]
MPQMMPINWIFIFIFIIIFIFMFNIMNYYIFYLNNKSYNNKFFYKKIKNLLWKW